MIPAKAAQPVHPASSPVVGVRPAGRQPTAGQEAPSPPCRKNLGTTSGHSANKINGFTGAKPRGGAPKGNSNAFKHGRYAKAFLARRAEVSAILRTTRTVRALIAAERAKRRFLGLPTHTMAYHFIHKYPDGSCHTRLVTVAFCGRHPITKTVQILSGTAAESAGPIHESTPAQHLSDPASHPAPAGETSSPQVVRCDPPRAANAQELGLSGTSSPPPRKSRAKVLTRKQNQPRTISRVSDLFGRDSRPPTENQRKC